MKIIHQNLHLIDNALDQAGGALREITTHAESFLVLVYVGVIANTWERFRG